MKLITIVFGILLAVLGVWDYTVAGAASVWALLPALFGLLAIFFGVLQGRYKHKRAEFGAVMMAILSFIGSIRGLWSLVILLGGGQPALPAELIWARSLRGLLSVAFVVTAYFLINNFWRHWQKFGHFLGDWLGRLALTVFYFTVFIPFGLGVRLFGDPLHIKSQPAELWRKRATGDQNLEEVLRQF